MGYREAKVKSVRMETEYSTAKSLFSNRRVIRVEMGVVQVGEAGE